MASVAMLHHLTQALVNFLQGELKKVGGPVASAAGVVVSHGFAESEVDAPILALRIVSTVENSTRRDGSFRTSLKGGEQVADKVSPPVWLDVVFLVEGLASSVAIEQELLSIALGACLRDRRIPAKHLPEPLALERLGEPALLLSPPPASDTAVRSHFYLTATFGFNPNLAWPVKLVREAVLSFGRTHGNGVLLPEDREISALSLSAAGVVLDPEGEPVVGAAILWPLMDRTILTNEKGVFIFVDLPAGRHSFRVSAKGFEPANFDALVPPVGPGRSREVEPVAVSLTRSESHEGPPGAPVFEQRRNIVKRVSGRLCLSSGVPAIHHRIRCGNTFTTTDLNGEYVLLLDPQAKVEIFAEIKELGEVPLDDFSKTMDTLPS